VCRYVARNALQAERTARAEDWRWDSLRRWQQPVEPVPTLRSSWPIPRAPHWLARVNEPLTDRELTDLLSSAQRGNPFGDSDWIETTAQRLGLAPTMNARGRRQVHFNDESDNNDSQPL